MRLFLTLFILVSVFSSCKKQYDTQAFWECHQELGLDSVAVTQKLKATWKWDRQSCPLRQGKADKEVIASFQDAGGYTLQEEGNIISQGTWTIRRYGNTGWELNLSSHTSYLTGEILFCKNEVMFYNSPVDGCDNIFRKQ